MTKIQEGYRVIVYAPDGTETFLAMEGRDLDRSKDRKAFVAEVASACAVQTAVTAPAMWTVEVQEKVHGEGGKVTRGLVELVGNVPAKDGHEAVAMVSSGKISSAYGANWTRYGYRAYRKGMAGKYPAEEVVTHFPGSRD